MRPEHFKTTYEWKSRKVAFLDQIWYVPVNISDDENFEFPGWEQLFGNSNPINIEYCSGNGAWIAEKALKNPNQNWLAVEKKYLRVKKIRSKIENFQLKNLIILCGEGLNATKRYFPKESIQKIYVNFPDPWPKKKHAKNRIINPIFADEMARLLKKEGTITMVTDDKNYSQEMITVFKNNNLFNSIYKEPYFVTSCNDYGSSYFEDLWVQQGKEIHYHEFKKIEEI